MKKLLKFSTMVVLLFFGKQNYAQNPLWSLPPNYLIGNQPQPLPQGSSPGYDEDYFSQTATNVHNAMSDASGNLLFFMVDDYVYDQGGYLIGHVKNATYGVEVKGTSEIVFVPDPENCQRYYIIAAGRKNYAFGFTNKLPYLAILDLSQPNTIHPSRFGVLENTSSGTASSIADITPNYNVYGNPKLGACFIAASKLRNDNSRLVFISNSYGIFRYKIDINGFNYDNYFLSFEVFNWNQFNLRGEMELVELSNGNYRIAVPYQVDGKVGVFTVELDNSGTLIGGTVERLSFNNDTNYPPYVHGLEFSPDGSKLYITHDIVTQHPNPFEFYDFNNPSMGVQPLNVTNAIDFKSSQIEIGKGGKLYLATSNRLATLSNPNIPDISNWTDVAQSISYEANYEGESTNSISGLKSYILPDQIDGMNYTTHFFVNLQCCIENREYTLETYSATSGAWNGSSPIAPGISTITIKDELRIPAGTTLTINNMTLQFAPGARLIIENGTNGVSGGKLTLNGSTLTIDNRCGSNNMWAGVQVWGNNNQIQGNIYSGSQGLLVMDAGSVIEHAIKGAVAVRINEDPNDPNNLNLYDYNYTGGVIIGRDSYFKNNVTDVEIMDYNPKSLVDNASKFTNCEFYTDGYLLNQAFHPETHVLLSGVSGIEFFGNTFENRTPHLYEDYIQGYGIRSRNSKFTVKAWCTGFYFPCTNYQPNLFKNLYHGVFALSSNPMRNVYISGNEFINNYRGILLSGIDYAAVLQNQFEVFPSHIDKTYGLYLEGCTSYKVEENYLTEYQPQNPSSFGKTYGIIVSNSGESHNEIYNNDFKHVNVGGQSQGINGVAYVGTNNHQIEGLQWKCNTFLKNMGTADLAITSGRIDYQQGYALSPQNHPVEALKSPAGNIFSHSASSDIFANNGVSEFVYYHHADNITTPFNYSSNVVTPHVSFNSTNLVYYDDTKSCPSKIRKNIVTVVHLNFLKMKVDSLDVTISDKVSQIDFGNTAYLLQLIATGSNGNVKNELMAASPYLSDEVLLAYIQSNPSNGNLKQVMLANSPLSQAVKQALSNLNLPNGTQNQIENAQEGVSEMQHLVSSISYDRSTRSFYLDELIRTYLNDTVIENPLDSVAMILKNEAAKQRKQHLCMTYLTKGDSIQTNSSKDELVAAYGMDNYVKMIKINQDKKKYPATCIALNTDADLKQRVLDVATDIQEKRSAVYAENVLTSAYDSLYLPVIEDIYPNNTAIGMQNTAPLQETSEALLSMYPNPSDGKSNVTITITAPQKINYNNAQIVIYSITGQLVATQDVISVDDNIILEATNMKKGIYLVKLYSNNQLKDIQKLVIR